MIIWLQVELELPFQVNISVSLRFWVTVNFG